MTRAPVVGWALDARLNAAELVRAVRHLDLDGIDLCLAPSLGLPVADRLTVLASAAPATRRIGLIAGQSPFAQPPYLTARSVGTLDAMTRGRAGWLVQPEAPRATRTDDSGRWEPTADESPETLARAAADHVAAVTALWDSWEPGAIVADVEAGQYVDDSRVHVVDHDGEFFRTRGPLNIPRSPQGRPVVATWIEAGAEVPAGVDLVVVELASRVDAIDEVARITGGADPAVAVLLAYAPPDGTAADPDRTTADVRELLAASGADGVVFTGVADAAVAGAIAGIVVPALRAGLTARTGSTLRARLGLEAVAPRRPATVTEGVLA